MILFDTTKSATAAHRSGLMRVSTRLLQALGPAATAVRWPVPEHAASAADWFFTAELFSEAERPGFGAWLDRRPCRVAAVFHDAIPLRHPHITWPQSVARHPGYMKLLARFDRVWAVSRASKQELEGFWSWLGLARTPAVDVLPLGADFADGPRAPATAPSAPARLLCIGILEPRKNQVFLTDVCTRLWNEGLRFELHVVGRVNPKFGAPVVAAVKQAGERFRGALVFHEHADDASIRRLYASARATVFPTIAEGCGLPLLESLWMGVPCVCSDLPVLRENAEDGGCLPVAVNDPAAWADALGRILTDDGLHRRLATEAANRVLPTWAGAAEALRAALGGQGATAARAG